MWTLKFLSFFFSKAKDKSGSTTKILTLVKSRCSTFGHVGCEQTSAITLSIIIKNATFSIMTLLILSG